MSTLLLDDLLEPIRPELAQVERVTQDALADATEPLGTALRHAVSGGKQLRPALAVLAGHMMGAPLTSVYRLAAALDLLHAATLIHDDVVDDAAERRGRHTLHTVWPTGATVLAGDYLLAQSIALIADLGQPRLLQVYAGVLRAMCAGEIRQSVTAQSQSGNREEYVRRIEAKTAAFLAASAEMAGLLAGASDAQLAALDAFGRELGLAYQIVDDVLDLVGDQDRLGKPVGSDLRQGLITLPIIYHLEQAGADDPVRAVLAGQRCTAHVRAASAVICQSGAIELALTEARDHARRSQAALTTLPDNDARQVLWSLVDYALARSQ